MGLAQLAGGGGDSGHGFDGDHSTAHCIQADYTGNAATEVVGVELGGVTTVGSWEADFKPLFSRARTAGVPIVLHSGENKVNQREWQQMMAFK